MTPTRRIAVVGGGVSGLVAAAELHRAGHDVELFEAGSYPGGHSNTIDVETGSGPLAVDTGFIVFNDRNYPNFERMLAELGHSVSQPANMSFSVSDGRGDFEWATRGPRGLFARPSHLVDRRFGRMLLELVRFNREARAPDRLTAGRAIAPPLPLRRDATPTTSSSASSFRRCPPSGRRTRSSSGASRPPSWPSSSRTTACSSWSAVPAGEPSPEAHGATSRH